MNRQHLQEIARQAAKETELIFAMRNFAGPEARDTLAAVVVASVFDEEYDSERKQALAQKRAELTSFIHTHYAPAEADYTWQLAQKQALHHLAVIAGIAEAEKSIKGRQIIAAFANLKEAEMEKRRGTPRGSLTPADYREISEMFKKTTHSSRDGQGQGPSKTFYEL